MGGLRVIHGQVLAKQQTPCSSKVDSLGSLKHRKGWRHGGRDGNGWGSGLGINVSMKMGGNEARCLKAIF